MFRALGSVVSRHWPIVIAVWLFGLAAGWLFAPSWQAVTIAEITTNTDFDALPPDSGIISPVARPGLDPPPDMVDQIKLLTAALPEWQPGKVSDPVQRGRMTRFMRDMTRHLRDQDPATGKPIDGPG